MWKWVLWLFALSFCFFAIQSGDTMMYLNIARDFILAGDWRQSDAHNYLYSATDGQLIWHHEYLTSLLFYGSWTMGGFPALIFLKAALLGLMFWLVLCHAPEERNSRVEWMAVWILAVLAASFRFIERASLFSDLFTVLTVSWLIREKTLSRSLLVRLCVLFLLWIQLHPGFVLGFIFVGLWVAWHSCFTAGFLNKNLLKILCVPLVMLLNPDVLNGILYPFRFALNEAHTLKLYNFEWLPAYHSVFRFSQEMLAFWCLVLFTSYFFVRERAWRNIEGLFALAALVLALSAVRFVPCMAMILALTAKPFVKFAQLNTRRPWLTGVIALLLLGVSVRNLGWGYGSSSGQRLPELGLDPKFFPNKTLEVLRQIHPKSFYNSHDFGAYLIWLGIKPVFHHGFVTDMNFYEKEAIGALQSPQQFLEIARKYDWKVLLVDRFGAYREIHRILSPLPEWKIVAEDEAAYLIVYLP